MLFVLPHRSPQMAERESSMPSRRQEEVKLVVCPASQGQPRKRYPQEGRPQASSKVPVCSSELVARYPMVTSKSGISFPKEQDLGKKSASDSVT